MISGNDFRVKSGFFTHFKTGRLENALGCEGIVKLLQLWGWVTENRPSGTLSGMTSDDIEFAVGWKGQRGSFVSTLVSIGWLDTTEDGTFCIHDWLEHNPWVAGATLRSDMGRMGKLASNYPEIYAKFAASGIRSISKKDYEAEIMIYKAQKTKSVSNFSYPCAPAPVPTTNNIDNDQDTDSTPNLHAGTVPDETERKETINLPKREDDGEDITQNMIPKGMTIEEVRKIRQEVREKPGFSNLPPFLQKSTLRVTPFTIAKEREMKLNTKKHEPDSSEILPGARAFSKLLRRTAELYRSFPGYKPTKGEDEWIVTICQSVGDKAYDIIRESRKWASEKNISVRNPRGFITEWVKRTLKEREVTASA